MVTKIFFILALICLIGTPIAFSNDSRKYLYIFLFTLIGCGLVMYQSFVEMITEAAHVCGYLLFGISLIILFIPKHVFENQRSR